MQEAQTPEMAPHSILDVLNENPTQGCFQSAEEVDAFIEAERNAWED